MTFQNMLKLKIYFDIFLLHSRFERECKQMIENSPISAEAKRDALRELAKATESTLLYAKVHIKHSRSGLYASDQVETIRS